MEVIMFSAADMLKFASMSTKELKEVLKDHGVNCNKLNKVQLQEAVLKVWQPIEEKPAEEKPKFERVAELLEKELAGYERLQEKYKQLFQQMGKYKADCEKYEGLYDKYRKLFIELRYKHDCLESDYNTLKEKKNDNTELFQRIENIARWKAPIGLYFNKSIDDEKDLLSFIDYTFKEYKKKYDEASNYMIMYFDYSGRYLKLLNSSGSSSDIFTKNKDKWKKVLKDMAIKYHPDHGGSHEMMVWVNEIRNELKGVL